MGQRRQANAEANDSSCSRRQVTDCGQRGQATVEYIATTLGIVAIFASASMLFAGRGVSEAVVRQMARAICVVGAGDCEEDRTPCVVASRRESSSKHVNAVIFRIGRDDAILREERSDGTVAITRIRDLSAGLDFGIGFDARVSLGKRSLLAGSTLRAAVLAHRGGGSTWILPDARAADRLVAQLAGKQPAGRQPSRRTGERAPPQAPPAGSLPRPGETSTDTAFSVTFDGDRGVGLAHVALTLESTDFFGSRIDHATGRRTIFVRRRNELTGAASLTGGVVKGGGVDGTGATDDLYAVTVDRDGRLVDLGIVEAGSYRVAADLPPKLRSVAGELDVPTAGGRLYETETHLDLTDPLNRAAARDFLEQVRSPRPHSGRIVRVAAALRKRLDAAGTVQARAYALDASTMGAAGHAAAVVKVGGGYERTVESARLVAAMSRGPGGAWTQRDDCLSAA
jgi:hypothetical protein